MLAALGRIVVVAIAVIVARISGAVGAVVSHIVGAAPASPRCSSRFDDHVVAATVGESIGDVSWCRCFDDDCDQNKDVSMTITATMSCPTRGFPTNGNLSTRCPMNNPFGRPPTHRRNAFGHAAPLLRQRDHAGSPSSQLRAAPVLHARGGAPPEELRAISGPHHRGIPATESRGVYTRSAT